MGNLMPNDRNVTLERKLLAVLWLLSTPESFRSVGDRFDLSKGNLHLICMNVITYIFSLRGEYILWPQRHHYRQIADDFVQAAGFPGVVGALDGTHINIEAPNEHRECYINRKGSASIQLQVVCNRSLLFTHVYSGYPGSVHDARVFRNSHLNVLLERDQLPPEYHILADSAYPQRRDIVTPYRDNGHLTRVQKNFNQVHSKTRVTVERAIGLLKGRFRRLKFLDMHVMEKIPQVIVACCVLHNMILDTDYDYDEFIDNDDMNDNVVNEQPAPRALIGVNEKRDNIARSLPFII